MELLVKKHCIVLLSVLTLLLFLSCNNNFSPIPVTGISIAAHENTLSLLKGTEHIIQAKVQPENATDKRLTYTSNNDEIASVNDKGLITAKAVGNAKITIKAANNISTEITVTVRAAHVAVTGISLSPNENNISMVNGSTKSMLMLCQRMQPIKA